MNTSDCTIEPFAAKADDFQLRDLRLRVLKVLRASDRYVANESVILNALRLQGHAISVEKLRVEIAWLGQVTATLRYHFYSDLCCAQLTDRGLAVADGTLVFPGIGLRSYEEPTAHSTAH